jgi:hypothetical protein
VSEIARRLFVGIDGRSIVPESDSIASTRFLMKGKQVVPLDMAFRTLTLTGSLGRKRITH